MGLSPRGLNRYAVWPLQFEHETFHMENRQHAEVSNGKWNFQKIMQKIRNAMSPSKDVSGLENRAIEHHAAEEKNRLLRHHQQPGRA